MLVIPVIYVVPQDADQVVAPALDGSGKHRLAAGVD
jgi:hypothetical protein